MLKLKCKRIAAYPYEFTTYMLKVYSMVAKTCIRTNDSKGYRRASDMMHEYTKTI